GVAAIVAAHRRFGTTALLPTLISDTAEKMRRALLAVQTMLGRDPSVLGIHFEGPFLSPEKPGVHDPAMIRGPEPADPALLTSLRGGVTLVTLAPEAVPAGFIGELTAAGVRVSLGHSMATYAQTRTALAEGLTGFTHLFNAMRPLASRDGGPIAAALECPAAWYGLIVDGVHVAPPMLRLALRGAGRPMLVTDAMPPVGASRRRSGCWRRGSPARSARGWKRPLRLSEHSTHARVHLHRLRHAICAERNAAAALHDLRGRSAICAATRADLDHARSARGESF